MTMKYLRDILYKTGIKELTGQVDLELAGITADSRQVKPGYLFLAQSGLQTDGHRYISKAIEAGALAIVCEKIPDERPGNITFIRVDNTGLALGIIAANFYDQPASRLKLIGVTGTNGKTSIVSLLYELFTRAGYPCGMLSTIRNMVAGKPFEATHTTPDPVSLNHYLHQMVVAGCEYAFMEVSSHAMVQQRTAGIRFTGGVFTNITHDHLDYHGSFRDYLEAKKSFFDGLDDKAFCLTNADDRNGMVMLQNTRAEKKTFGMRTPADFHARLLESSLSGMQMIVDNKEVWCKMVGRFNAYNLLAVYGTARMLGMDQEEVLTSLSQSTPPEGRFDQFISGDKITAIIDYAHTPDALENVLNTINEIRSGHETLTTVVGCGGNRDKAKRPLMAAIASKNSNRLILTSDNPRYENPESIIEEMKAGLDHEGRKKTIAITNRKEAIHAACSMARPGDIILVAGKGHEKYQEIEGKRHPFDDKMIAVECLDKQNN